MTFSKLKQLGAPPEDKDVYNYAMKYAVHLNEHIKSGKGLIMMGPVGTGKTSLAISILRRAIEQGYNGYLISMMSLLDTLLVLSKGPAEHYLKFENRIRNCPLLVLDDFGPNTIINGFQVRLIRLFLTELNVEKRLLSLRIYLFNKLRSVMIAVFMID